MSSIKTAISLEEPLFREAEVLARELRISRSQFFSLAVREFIKQTRSRDLFEKINRVYRDEPAPEEKALRERRKSYQRRMVKGAW